MRERGERGRKREKEREIDEEKEKIIIMPNFSKLSNFCKIEMLPLFYCY